MAWKSIIRRSNPILWTVLSFFVIALPQWFESIWSLFYEKPFATVLRNWMGDTMMPSFSPYWITIPIGLLMFGLTIFELRKSRSAERRDEVIETVTEIPDEEKGILDFGAGIEEAIKEQRITLLRLTANLKKLKRTVARHARWLGTAKSFNIKRQRAVRAAQAIDRVSMSIDPDIVRLEKSASLLQESFVGFVELNNDREVLDLFRKPTLILLDSAPDAISSMKTFQSTLETLQAKRAQQTLNEVVSRLGERVKRIINSLEIVRFTCERAVTSIDEKTMRR